MATPGSRSGNRGEGQGYPRPNPKRITNVGSSQPIRRSTEGEYEKPAASSVTPPSARVPSLLKDEVRELISLMAVSDLTEINIENGPYRVLIKREPPRLVRADYAPARGAKASRMVAAATNTPPVETAPISDPGSPPEDTFHKVTAPMVGTVYRSPDPKTTPFVKEGDTVEKGQVIGIIEAMKIMNEIQSEHAGRCLRVLVQNGQPVEYGQTLLVLEPA